MPSYKEKTLEIIKKEKDSASKYDLSEANVIKTLKIDMSKVSSGRVYFYPKTNKCYNVVEAKKENGETVYAKMVEHKGEAELILTDLDEISTMRDYVFVNIKLCGEYGTEDIINAPIKLQGIIESELSSAIMGATGRGISMFKFFHDANLVEKDNTLSKLSNIKDNMFLLGTTGFSKMYTFKRFPKTYEWSYWGYYGTTIDAIAFTPNQNIVLCGFTIYATDREYFELKYKIYVDDNVMEEEDGPLK